MAFTADCVGFLLNNEQIFERCVDFCTLQRFWSLMQQRERERTAQCFGLTATDFPERMAKLSVNEFVSALDDNLLADYMTLLNLTHVNRGDRDEVRRLACDELILSGVLHILTHVKPQLMHEVAEALGIIFTDADSDATIADWIMCVAHNLDPIPGGKWPTLAKSEEKSGGGNKRGASRSTRSSGVKKSDDDDMADEDDAKEEEEDEEEEEVTKPSKRKSSSTRSGSGSRRKEVEKDDEEEDEEEEEEEERPDKRRRLSSDSEGRKSKKGKSVKKEKEEEEEDDDEKEEEEEQKDGDDGKGDEHPVDRGYYTEDGRWVHPPFELVMAKKFDAQGLNNNFNLPDLLEFCKLHDIPVSSSAKKKNAVIRIVLQFVETGAVPNSGKRKSGSAKKPKTAKKGDEGDDNPATEEGDDGDEEEDGASKEEGN